MPKYFVGFLKKCFYLCNLYLFNSGSQEVLDTSHASYPTSDYKPPVSPGVDSDDYEDDDHHRPKNYEAQAPCPQYAGKFS